MNFKHWQSIYDVVFLLDCKVCDNSTYVLSSGLVSPVQSKLITSVYVSGCVADNDDVNPLLPVLKIPAACQPSEQAHKTRHLAA